MKPKTAIRRFDVFAEYNRQTALKDGSSAAQAKGYGLWLAKVVAARRFGRGKGATGKGQAEEEKERPRSKWHTLDGKPQTDKLFDKEIIQRMGSDFYSDVFVPAIQESIEKGQKYIQIRDAIRKDWKP